MFLVLGINASGALPLDGWDLSIASALILVAGGVSVALRLGMEKELAVAALRTVLQLLLVGYILRSVFELENAWLIALLVTLMIALASRAAIKRPSRTFKGVGWLTFATLLVTGIATTLTVTSAIIGVEPFYSPQYLIPLLGMVLGNGLTGISLCLDALLQSLSFHRHEVEMELAHGATRWEAARQPVSEAVRRGMIPIINSMMIVGIVSLPGMMTGQILAGEDPLRAVQYQIVVMFMIAAATSAGCILTSMLVYWRLFNSRHQLRHELIQNVGRR